MKFQLRERGSREFTDKELKEILEYETKSQFLEAEREKYREMLIDEQISLEKNRDIEIKEFNFKLGQLTFDKLKIDSAIGQEEMKILMLALYNFRRMIHQDDEMKLRRNIENVKEWIEELSQIQTEIQEKISDIKNNYENLNSKDKQLDKQFKANFSEAAPAAPVDQAYKYFK